MTKKLFLFALIACILLTLSACSEEQPGGVQFGEYELASEQLTQQEASVTYDPADLIDAEMSWQSAYALSYSYYDNKNGESKIAEGKCGRYFQSLDYATDIITYYTQEEGYVMEYVLNTNLKNGTSTVVTDSTLDNAYSGFCKLSTCDPYFPVYNNVTEVGQDFVADRAATRYKQVETKDGVTTRIAYVWIDNAYGFASKCELYDAQTQELQMRWELLEFTQNVTEDGIRVNLDAYSLTSDE